MKTCKRKKKYPKDAIYKAKDPCGSVYVYKFKPFLSDIGWYPAVGDESYCVKSQYCCRKKNKKWKKSLRIIVGE